MSSHDQIASFTIGDKTFTQEDIIDVALNNHREYPATFLAQFEEIKDMKNPFEMADNIAQAFKIAFGLIIVDSEYYYCQHNFHTIMDEIKEMCDPVMSWIFARAFKEAGFKYARECDPTELRALYAQTGYPAYGISSIIGGGERRGVPHTTYVYDEIKKDKASLHKDLIEYIYQPRLIEAWINKGYSIEDYLN